MKALLLAVLVAAPCVAFAAESPRTVPLVGAGGKEMGFAVFEESPRGVLVRLSLQGLAPGWHGVHLHMVGRCDGPGFDSAGGHVHAGSGASVHGLLNPQGNDTGDLPNVFIGPLGTGESEIFSPMATLRGAAGRSNLLDADGSAIVVHENRDDHRSQPIGGAGPRVACGVIR